MAEFFEGMMLVCFGFAWPFSIHRSLITKKNYGKSVVFLVVVFVGYLAGITNKLLGKYEPVIYLYVINALMVLADIMIFVRNDKLEKEYID